MTPLIIDSFAGGGGASTGIEMALGRSPDIAINHNAAALAMHMANHSDTLHLSKNIWQVDPLEAVGNRPVGLAWFSPDCKHFSKAKGGKPVKRNVRDLAWTVVLWAKRARPSIIILENVEEFADWGPLVEMPDGSFRPCPDRKGETFRKWVGELKRLGYRVEHRELVAADYGAPTTRKRLFLIARRDGLKIVWPKPTHGRPTDPDVVAGRKLPWRTAAEIIDWSIPCPSIFDTSAEIMAKHGVRAVRPLADATMARVARGVKRYVLDAAKPFIVKFQTGSTGSAINDPLPTVTANSFHKRPGGAAPVGLVVPSIAAIANGDGLGGVRREHCVTEPLRTQHAGGNKFALVAPVLTAAQHGGSNRGAGEPMRTIAASDKDQHAVIAPSLMPLTHQGGDRNHSAEEPMRTITTAHRGEVALLAPHLMTMRNAEKPFNEADKPTHTITAGGAGLSLVAAHLSRQFGQGTGRSADEPAPTTTADGGGKTAVVAAFLAQHNNDSRRIGGVNPGQPADRPVSTITATGSQQGVVAAHLQNMRGSDRRDSAIDDPARTISAGGTHAALVSAFMMKYYGAGDGQVCDDPFATVTTKDRFGLVTVEIEGESHVITDIGMRMLTPRELFSAQGFPPDYRIDGIAYDGRVLTKSEQISCVGNSVCPPLAAALVAANAGHLAVAPAMEAAE